MYTYLACPTSHRVWSGGQYRPTVQWLWSCLERSLSISDPHGTTFNPACHAQLENTHPIWSSETDEPRTNKKTHYQILKHQIFFFYLGPAFTLKMKKCQRLLFPYEARTTVLPLTLRASGIMRSSWRRAGAHLQLGHVHPRAGVTGYWGRDRKSMKSDTFL